MGTKLNIGKKGKGNKDGKKEGSKKILAYAYAPKTNFRPVSRLKCNAGFHCHDIKYKYQNPSIDRVQNLGNKGD